VKTVYLLRHAKSSWDQPYLDDYQRPLAPRGLNAAPRLGRYMSKEKLIPERVLCSGARRAQETWDLVSDALEVTVPVNVLPEIYHGSTGTLKGLIHGLPDSEDSVLLVGHNPTFHDFALSLAGSGEEEAIQRLRFKYPTGSLAILDFGVQEWREVREGTGHLRDFIRPKGLK
jgi:phosphohistidine phosphatase